MQNLEAVLPAMLIDTVREQLRRVEVLGKDIAEIERRLAAWKKDDRASKTLMGIPGVGLLSATAAVATIGDARAFASGRAFAAFVGLVPRQSGTGGRVNKERDPWLEQLLARRPFNAAVVALANKMARTIWALLAHDRTYQKGYAARAA